MAVSKQELAGWLAEPSADELRKELELHVENARADLLSRALKSSDAAVRAAGERIQTTLELLKRLKAE